MRNANVVLEKPPLSSPFWRSYLALCKFKVVMMLVLTALTGMILAPNSHLHGLTIVIASLAIGLAASSAAVINHIVDSHIDRKMQRTKARPIATGEIKPINAFIFAFTLLISSMILLLIYANVLTAILTFLGFIGYALIYTVYLKHASVYNIVWGGISGALPPLLGWVSITNQITLEPVLLVTIIFLWTPAHFWPLAIARINDYKKAKVPMMPVVKGVNHTLNSILIYGGLTVTFALIPYLTGWMQEYYLVAALVLGCWFFSSLLTLYKDCTVRNAMRAFYVSIYYLLGIFSALIFDHFVSL